MNGQNLQTAFVPLLAGAQAVYNGNALSRYRHPDWLGSSRVASDPNQYIYYDGAYAPFGETYLETPTPDRSFTGQTQEVVQGQTGIYDFLYRQHAASQGRWLTPDPAGLAAVDIANPQTWNRYAYAANNPLSNIDLLGLDCVFLNDSGNGIEEVDSDFDTQPGDCGNQGGYYLPGQLTGYTTDRADPNNVITALQYSPYSSFNDMIGPQPTFGGQFININYLPYSLSRDQVKQLIQDNNKSELSDDTIACIIGIEDSTGNPQSVYLSSTNPFGLPLSVPGNTMKGLMQVSNGAAADVVNSGYIQGMTAEQLQQSLFNPQVNIQAGTSYIQLLIDRFGKNNWAKHYGPNESKCK